MTRPRGFAPWSPRPAAQEMVADILGALDDYADHLPVTLRQVFYRLVGTKDYPKDEAAYNRLLDVANRGRRAGLIPFDAVRDDGVQLVEPLGYDSPEQWLSGIEYSARAFRRERQAVQADRVEVWCEAGGMLPQIARVAEPFGITAQSTGGFDSVTAKHTAAERIVADGRPCVVLHIGDHDPSGVALFTAMAEDVDAFVRGYGHAGIKVIRVAVTAAQAEDHDLPGYPPKATDRRGGFVGLTYQAEALDPGVLAGYLRAAVLDHTDKDVHEAVLVAERGERDQLVRIIQEAAL